MIVISYYILSFQLLIPSLRLIFDQVVLWIFFLVCTLLYSFQLTSFKFSPNLTKFLQNEISKLGFEIKRKIKIGLSFLLFNSISLVMIILLSISFFLNYIFASLIIRIIIVYFFSIIIIPILRGVLHDRFIIELKPPYFIQIDLKINLIKHIEVESQMVRIFMTSNKLGLKYNQHYYDIYTEISNKRWLPRKGNFRLLYFLNKSRLFLYEYSTIINFKEHFLNLVSAIREWDTTIKKAT